MAFPRPLIVPTSNIVMDFHGSNFSAVNSVFNYVSGNQVNNNFNTSPSPREAIVNNNTTVRHDNTSSSPRETEGPPVNILTFDGGGFRGLASLYILKALMGRLLPDVKRPSDIRPCEHFDLIGGTSAGGLNALLLGRLGLTIGEAIKTFEELGPEIFGKKRDWILALFRRNKFDHKPLEKALKALCNDRLLKDDLPMRSEDGTSLGTRCFVTTAYKETHVVVTLRSYDIDRSLAPPTFDGDDNWKIWEAARSTSAAQLYFAPFKLSRNGRTRGEFEDAGLSGMNNPILLAIAEKGFIKELAGRPVGCLVSIGTGTSNVFPRPVGMLPTRIAKVLAHLLAVATDAEKIAQVVGHTEELRNRFFRFNPSSELYNLDFTDLTCAEKYEPIVLDYVGKRETQDKMDQCKSWIR